MEPLTLTGDATRNMVAMDIMQYTSTIDSSHFAMQPAPATSIKPELAYFSVWMAVFRLFCRQLGRMLGFTLLIAAPFFILNAIVHAHHMMTLGSAGLTQTEIPVEQMRVLWLSLVLGDTLAFVTLSISTFILLKHIWGTEHRSIIRLALRELGQLLCSLRFWPFVLVQLFVFILINSPSGDLKIGGMLLFGASVLMLFAAHDRAAPAHGARLQLRWTGWLSLVLVLISFAVLYVLLNGFADYLLLMMMDMGAAKLLDWFQPGSPVLPFTAIFAAKFISQWFNLLPMALLACTYSAIRGTPAVRPSTV
ncbi:hypothetical protein BH11PSE11_BH11PSE11_14320 [soil metagenome]